MKIKWNFLGGGEVQNKYNLLWGEYGYFVELHNPQREKKNTPIHSDFLKMH